MEKKSSNINYLSFNLDSSCFNVGLNDGFVIYNVDPIKPRFKVENIGPIKIVEILFKTNIVAYVGTKNNKQYPPNVVIVWDDQISKIIGMLTYNEGDEIEILKMRADKIIIMTRNTLRIIAMEDFKEIEQYEISEFCPKLCAISAAKNNTVLAWNSAEIGTINVKLFEKQRYYKLKCHNGHIKQLALSVDGKLLATASEKGTLIRIYDTSTGKKIQEVRRGSRLAIIQSIKFSKNAEFICVTSSTGTAHLFAIRNNINMSHKNNKTLSSLSFMNSLLPSYCSSEWSFAQIYVPNSKCCLAAFGNDSNIIILITTAGSYYKYLFTPGKKHIKHLEGFKWIKD